MLVPRALLVVGPFLTVSCCVGQPLDSACVTTVISADDTSRADTVGITYYDRDGREREEFGWFTGEQVPVHDSYTYDRKGRLKTQLTDFRGKNRHEFHYRHGRLYSVTDHGLNARGRWEKTGVTIWEYDSQGRVSRISNPPEWYDNYTRTFVYDTLGRRTMQVNLDAYGKAVHRCRTYYNVRDVAPLMAELESDSLSAIEVENRDERGWVVERYGLIKGKVNSHLQYSYDERGRLRTTVGLRSTTRYEYRRLPRRTVQ